MKKTILLFLLLLLIFCFLDISGQTIYYIFNKKFTWDYYNQKTQDVFKIHGFTKYTSDSRVVTLKKNTTYTYKTNGHWDIAIDSNQFRIGNNSYSKNKKNYVFIGDSVPFGWGLPGDKTVPSRFYDILQETSTGNYGVINAAIPSYSLYQAICRYKIEIHKKYPVKCVILQIFDPAIQFTIDGPKWNKYRCWANRYSDYKMLQVFQSNYSLLLKHSFLFYIVDKHSQNISKKIYPSNNYPEPERFFKEQNFETLNELHELLQEEQTPLIILAINPADKKQSTLKQFYHAIDLLNKTLKEYSNTHDNVYFLDINDYFNSLGQDNLFTDSCHLSAKGAELQAKYIFEKMINYKLTK